MQPGNAGRASEKRVRWSCWLLLVFFLCCNNSGAHAQASFYTVSGWGMDDGLPHNYVHALAQGRDGLIWVGTWEGVARFTGRGFTVYDRQSRLGLELDGVYVVQRDAGDGILFGTAYGGVYRYLRGNWEQIGEARAHRLQVTSLLHDDDGALWVGTPKNLYRIERDGRLVAAGADAGLPDTRVTSLLRHVDGQLLVGTVTGVFSIDDDGIARPWATDHMRRVAVWQLQQDREGGLLVASDDGIWWWRRDGLHEHLRRGERILAVLQDRHGQLWMNHYAGSLILHRGQRQPDVEIPVPGFVSSALMEDEEGLIWVGSTHGMFRVVEAGARGITSADGLDSGYVRTVVQTADDAIWIGHSAGLARLHEGVLSRVPLSSLTKGLSSPSVLALVADGRDGVWVGTHDAGVLRVAADGGVTEKIGEEQGLPASNIRALLAEPDGGLWIGTAAGLVYRGEGRIRLYGVDAGTSLLSVQALYRDSHGTLWVGSNQGMVALGADGRLRRWTDNGEFPANDVFDFLEDAGGGLWIASDRGLLRLRDGKLNVYDHRVGLPRDKLFRILDDGMGCFWLSSNHGVFRIARVEFDAIDAGQRKQLAVHVVDRSDGMPSSQGNGGSSPAGWRAKSGELLIPTSDGLGVIDPKEVGGEKQRRVPVVFERVLADGVAQSQEGGLRLAAQTRRLLINYAGMSFRAPDKVRYRYRLQGFDADWIDAGSTVEAVYTNLAPGHYRFDVQAMSLPVNWNETERVGSKELIFELEPPWWRRVEFMVIEVLLMVAALYLLFRWRTTRYRSSQRQLNVLIEQRTRELSEMNRALLAADLQRQDLVNKLEYQANHDVLTGLPNRREAERYLQQVMDDSIINATPLAVALLDIDHFKHINDNFGHPIGDEVLRRVGRVLAAAMDQTLFAARLGGEEFLLVAIEMDEIKARARFECAREQVGAIEVDVDTVAARCTASMGMAMYGVDMDGRRELLARADHRLYLAKDGGRDRLVADDAGG